jgi:cytochrome c-type biogenesis protein CcmE
MDLTPRDSDDGPRKRRRRNWPAAGLLAVALIGIGVVLFEGLSSATSYYCTADEVGEKSGCSGTKRFRLEGTVVPGTVVNSADSVDFSVLAKGVTVAVHHRGAPQELFRECIAVVVEGTLNPAGTAERREFESDEMLVKHSERYAKANPDRVTPDTSCADR